jgi:hypothetical protein
MISTASETLCTILHTFADRSASAEEAGVLDETFRVACASFAPIRLYVFKARTVALLVQHAVDRIEDV